MIWNFVVAAACFVEALALERNFVAAACFGKAPALDRSRIYTALRAGRERTQREPFRTTWLY